MAFPPKLVAEQLTSIDAVSSGAPRPGGRGRLASCCHLPQSCLSLMRTCGRGPDLSSIPYQPPHPVQFLKPLLSRSSCRLWS